MDPLEHHQELWSNTQVTNTCATHKSTSSPTMQTRRSIRSKESSPRQPYTLQTLPKSSYRRALEAATRPRSNKVDKRDIAVVRKPSNASAPFKTAKNIPDFIQTVHPLQPPTTSVRGLTRGKERTGNMAGTLRNLGPDRIGIIGGYIALAGGSESNLTYLRMSPPS